jgi:hypothetical protein
MKKTALLSIILASAPAFAADVATTPEFEALKAEAAAPADPAIAAPKDLAAAPADLAAAPKDLAAIEAARDPWYRGLGFGIGAGALSGVTGELSYRIPYSNSFWGNRFGFRLNYSTMKPLKSSIDKVVKTMSDDEEDIDVDATIDSSQIGAMIDFYPFGYVWGLGALRFTGGYYVGKFDIDAKITASTSFDGQATINVNHPDYGYLSSQSVAYTGNAYGNGVVSLDYGTIKGPYAGIGLDMGLFWGLRLAMDVGVVFTDAPQVSAQIGNADANIDQLCFNGGLYNGQCFGWDKVDQATATAIITEMDDEKAKALADANKEIDSNLKDLNDSLAKYDYFPIVRVALTYRF